MGNQATDLAKSFRTAMEIEDNGLITFLRFARRTKVEAGKNMFIRLAMDEHEHRRILEKQLSQVMEGKPLEHIEIPKWEIEKVAPAIREKQQRIKGESDLGELDALNTALDLERKAAGFFREQAEQASDPEAKALFQKLAEWEDGHFDLIQAELDHINQTGSWFDVREFRMDGKY